jgi:hypothetical protein
LDDSYPPRERFYLVGLWHHGQRQTNDLGELDHYDFVSGDALFQADLLIKKPPIGGFSWESFNTRPH